MQEGGVGMEATAGVLWKMVPEPGGATPEGGDRFRMEYGILGGTEARVGSWWLKL